MNRSCPDVSRRRLLLCVTGILVLYGPVASTQAQVKLTSIQGSVFFERGDAGLTQLGEAVIENSSPEKAQAILRGEIAGKQICTVSTTLPQGATTVRFPFPDITEPTSATFVVSVNGRE